MNAKDKNDVNPECLAQAKNLVDMIQYADGSIVSKTIVDKKAGTLTLFAFDKGQKLSEHQAPFDATVQILDGTGQITIDGKPINVTAGEIIVMPANIPHAVNANEKFKMLLIMIRQI